MFVDVIIHTSYQKSVRLFWKQTVGKRVVNFDGAPFSVGEKQNLHCQYGTKYYKSAEKSNTKLHLQGTYKMGCKAHIELIEYAIYPEYAVLSRSRFTLINKTQRKIRKNRFTKLREALANDKKITTEHKYYVCLPFCEPHHMCHPTGREIGN